MACVRVAGSVCAVLCTSVGWWYAATSRLDNDNNYCRRIPSQQFGQEHAGNSRGSCIGLGPCAFPFWRDLGVLGVVVGGQWTPERWETLSRDAVQSSPACTEHVLYSAVLHEYCTVVLTRGAPSRLRRPRLRKLPLNCSTVRLPLVLHLFH